MKNKIIVWLCLICVIFSIFKLCTLPDKSELYTKEVATLIIKEKEISEGMDERIYTSYQFYFKFCDGRHIRKEYSLYEFKTLDIGEEYVITYRNDKIDYTCAYFLLLVFSVLIGIYYIVNTNNKHEKDELTYWDH